MLSGKVQCSTEQFIHRALRAFDSALTADPHGVKKVFLQQRPSTLDAATTVDTKKDDWVSVAIDLSSEQHRIFELMCEFLETDSRAEVLTEALRLADKATVTV